MRKRVLRKTKVICMILVALMVFTTAFLNMDFKVFAEEPEDIIETEIVTADAEIVDEVDVDAVEEPEAVAETAEDEEVTEEESESIVEAACEEVVETVEEEAAEEVVAEEAAEDLPVLEDQEFVFDLSVPADVCDESEILSVEEYFDREVDQELYSKYNASTFNGDNLTGLNRRLYDNLKIMAGEVAEGKRTSTYFRMSVSDLGIGNTYTAAELGQSTINNAAAEELLYKIGWDKIDIGLITDALSMDCPYEMYWRGLESGITEYPQFEIVYVNGQQALRLTGYVTYYIKVSSEYKANDEFTVNTSKVTAVKAASKNINNIINQAKNKNDLEKVTFYKDQICALTTYNWDALGNPDPYYYGDPWQLIYVFDGNSNTNVVCEGYSKAFAYLCEKTNFADSSVNCYIVTGTMDGGPHMWNILRWSDGKNYLVDVTNCDDLGNDLFMAVPKSGSVSAGYTYKLLNNNIKFVYDDDTKAQYSTEDLTIGSKLTSALKDISLEYSAFIKSKTAVPFTIVREGGTNATQFRLDSVVYVENNTTIFTGSYGNDNVINVTFPEKGKYILQFSAKDSDGTVKSRTVSVDVKEGEGVEDFVARFYTIILDREAEPEGLQNWVTALEAGTRGGADVADEFIHSPEFQAKKLSDDAYITKLYRAFFNREPDAAGKASWLQSIAEGKDRDFVLEGFLASDEYRNLCNRYGIKRESTRTFVKRFYSVAFGRTGNNISPAELDNWQVPLDAHALTGADIAVQFFNSPEYLLHNDNEEQYLGKLYRVLFNRDMDAGGKQIWTQAFAQGYDRNAVLEEFLKSGEFKDMCNMYGINPGR